MGRHTADKGVANKGKPHSRRGDVVGGHLLVHLKEHLGPQIISLEDGQSPFPCVILRFEKDEGFLPKGGEGHLRQLRFEKRTIANLLYRDLKRLQLLVYRKSPGNRQQQPFPPKYTPVKNLTVQFAVIQQKVHLTGLQHSGQVTGGFLHQLHIDTGIPPGKIRHQRR